MLKTYMGSCHCGAIAFECDLDLTEGTRRCNCSFCTKTRFWKAFAKGNSFRLIQGANELSDYEFTPSSAPSPMLHHLFCRRCGVRSFTKGWLAEFGGDFYAVNLACLDNAEADLAAAPIQYEDGRNDDWDSCPQVTHYL
jgi:hypothetical protein